MTQAMLLNFKKRVECRLNHLSIPFRLGYALMEGEIFSKFSKYEMKNR